MTFSENALPHYDELTKFVSSSGWLQEQVFQKFSTQQSELIALREKEQSLSSDLMRERETARGLQAEVDSATARMKQLEVDAEESIMGAADSKKFAEDAQRKIDDHMSQISS